MTSESLPPGEPAGIGPDLVIQIARRRPAELVVITDPLLLRARAQQLQLPLSISEFFPDKKPSPQQAHTLTVLPVALRTNVTAGILNPANAIYVLETLQQAASLCEHKLADALVTGPVHKGIMNQAGIAFSGHTEWLAQHAGVKKTVMLFVHEQLRVALATTHLPLAQVPSAITKAELRSTITVLHQALRAQFHLEAPRIVVCGLNPHAGENGYLGREEIDIITPLLDEMRQEHFHLTGPLPADTVFTQKNLKAADAVLAMYHDQALPIVKYIGFGHAVNMTLGLPYVRTSVDHGTALDLAGTGKADVGSLKAALSLALALV